MRERGIRVLALALAACLALPPGSAPAQAPPVDPDLAAGIAQVREGEFETALQTLDAAVRRLAARKGQSRELARAYTYLAIAYVGLAQQEAARAKFVEAWKVDNSLTLSPKEYPPGIIELFEQARRSVQPPAPSPAVPATTAASAAGPPAAPVAAASPVPVAAASPAPAAAAPAPSLPRPRPSPSVSTASVPKKGGSGRLVLLGVGGLAAAGVAVAAGGGGGEGAPTPVATCAPGLFQVTNALFSTTSYVCPPGRSTVSLYISADVVNTSDATVTINGVRAGTTCSDMCQGCFCTGAAVEARTFSPTQFRPGERSFLVTKIADTVCDNQGGEGWFDLRGTMVVDSTCGSFTLTTGNFIQYKWP